jgi:hypothetical protein
MDVDPISPDVDAFDQGSKEGTLACCGQLGPALPDFAGSRDQPALRCRIGKPFRLVDAAGIDKPLPYAAGHRLLYFPGWGAQAGGSVGLIVGDQRSGDIVAISPPFLGRMGRRHSIAVAVE